MLHFLTMLIAFMEAESFTTRAPKIRRSSTARFFTNTNDPPSHDPSSLSLQSLIATERWIDSSYLSTKHTRKQLNFSSSSHTSPLLVAADILKLVALLRATPPSPSPSSSSGRKTNVLVCSSCALFKSFPKFESTIGAIKNILKNEAFFTESSQQTIITIELDRLREAGKNTQNPNNFPSQLSTSVSLSLLHPDFSFGANDEGDKRESRLLARQSPFPSLIVEVKAKPPEPPPNQPNREQIALEDVLEKEEPGKSSLEMAFLKNAAVPNPVPVREDSSTNAAFDALQSPEVKTKVWFDVAGNTNIEAVSEVVSIASGLSNVEIVSEIALRVATGMESDETIAFLIRGGGSATALGRLAKNVGELLLSCEEGGGEGGAVEGTRKWLVDCFSPEEVEKERVCPHGRILTVTKR